jgi:hypothetical protein
VSAPFSTVESDLMPLPWLGLIDTLLDVANVALSKKARRQAGEAESEQAERERLRIALLQKLELLRQAGDREIGRLRLMAGLAVGSWIGTLFFSARLARGPIAARIVLGTGWLLLLVALALSFVAQARVVRALARIDESDPGHDDLTGGAAGALAPWLIATGLAVVGLALLLA